jgi:hypothetical protein
VEVLPTDLHNDGELIPPFVELLQQFGFEFGILCEQGNLFIIQFNFKLSIFSIFQ